MKKRIMVVMVVIASVMVAGFALAGNMPVFGDMGIAGHAEVKSSMSADKVVTFQVPVIPEQLIKDGIKNPKWQLYVSFSLGNNAEKRWDLYPKESYAVTTVQNGNWLVASVDFKEAAKANVETARIRIWGKDLNSGKWLWIEQKSKYARLDVKKQISYEQKINLISNNVEVVNPLDALWR